MSLPNTKIASTFIESYVTIRKAGWKLNVSDGDLISIPGGTVKHKLDVCLTLLEAFNNAKTFEDWIKILDEIYIREREELETYRNRYAFVRAIINQPLIGNMLHAVRTYIVSELKNEPEFRQLKDDLAFRKKELEKQILWDKQHNTLKTVIDSNQKLLDKIDHTLETRNDMDEYFVKFFNETILVHDMEAKKFDEKLFDDLKQNVIKGKRTLVICQRLLEDNAKKTINMTVTEDHITPLSLPNEQSLTVVEKNEDVSCTMEQNHTLLPTAQTYSSVVIEGNRKRESSLQTLSTFAKSEERNAVPRRQSARIANHYEVLSDSPYTKNKRYRNY